MRGAFLHRTEPEDNRSCSSPESINPQHSRASYSNANCIIWPNFKFVRDFGISKFDQVSKQK